MSGSASKYHEGEMAVQDRVGTRVAAERLANGIEPQILLGARPFLPQQKLLALAVGDRAGGIGASVWFGVPGFAESRDDGRILWIDRSKRLPLDVDPAGERLLEGAAVGVLAIELETRRRLRVNGRVRAVDATRLVLDVAESFPNCPKYITKRQVVLANADPTARSEPPAHGLVLDGPRLETVRRCDTLFVASSHPACGADASHRGGEPGFVRALNERTLRIPDYAGNNMFQTLGNLSSTPRAALVFVDFEGRRLLHVNGAATVRFDDGTSRTGGTGRSWDLRIERWSEGAMPADVNAVLLERSRFNPRL